MDWWRLKRCEYFSLFGDEFIREAAAASDFIRIHQNSSTRVAAVVFCFISPRSSPTKM